MKVRECNVIFSDGRTLAPGEYTLIVEELDDDILTEQDIIDIEKAREEYKQGKTISWEEVKKELDKKWGLD